MTFHELLTEAAVAIAAAELRAQPVPMRDYPSVARRAVALAREIVTLVLQEDGPA